MDIEQEDLKFLGVRGIFKESFRIIFSWRKIFSQITLAFILPLSFIFLAHMQVSQLLFFNILDREDTFFHTRNDSPVHSKLASALSHEWVAFLLFKAAYLILLLILSLFSTSAVVYTVASIYTAKDLTFKKVTIVVPKVWKRLLVTFIWSFAIAFFYYIAALILLILWVIFIGPSATGIAIGVILLILYLMGFVYISIIWNLASVVTVLEDSYGRSAMMKSKALIKGKMVEAIVIFFVLCICFLGIQVVFENFVVIGWIGGVGVRIGVGIICLLFLFKVYLFGLIIQTVLYFVCKSYHRENIDKSMLACHLEAYLGEFVPLKAKDVQLGELHV